MSEPRDLYRLRSDGAPREIPPEARVPTRHWFVALRSRRLVVVCVVLTIVAAWGWIHANDLQNRLEAILGQGVRSIKELQSQVEESKKQEQIAEEKLKEKEAAFDRAQQGLNVANDRVNALQHDLKVAKETADRLKQELNSIKNKALTTEQEISAAKSRAEKAEQELSAAQTKLDAIKLELSAANSRADKAEEQLRALQKKNLLKPPSRAPIKLDETNASAPDGGS